MLSINITYKTTSSIDAAAPAASIAIITIITTITITTTTTIITTGIIATAFNASTTDQNAHYNTYHYA